MDNSLYIGKYIHILRNAGDRTPTHVHPKEHAHLILMGGVAAKIGDADLVQYMAPAVIFTPAGAEHHFEATHPNTVIQCAFRFYGEPTGGK
jgi:quercetin dioxygenase-like cupin family protein